MIEEIKKDRHGEYIGYEEVLIQMVEELESKITEFCDKNDFSGILNSHFLRKDAVEARIMKLEADLAKEKEKVKEDGDFIEFLEQKINKLSDRVKGLDINLQSLTPGGSEYVNDPKRCVDYAKGVMHSQLHKIVELTKRVKALEEGITYLVDYDTSQLKELIEG